MREKLGLKLPGQRLEGKIFKQAYVIYTLVSYPRAQFWAFHYNSLANHCAGIQFLCWYHSPQSWRQMDNPTHNHPSLALGDLAYRHAPCKDEDLSETGPNEQNHCNQNKNTASHHAWCCFSRLCGSSLLQQILPKGQAHPLGQLYLLA